MLKITREIGLIIGLFLFLALGIHMKDWISNPLKHIDDLQESHFGPYHPLFFTLIIYIVFVLIRVIYSFIVGLFARKA